MFHRLTTLDVESRISTLESLLEKGFGMFGFHKNNGLSNDVKEFIVTYNQQSNRSKLCVDENNVYCVAIQFHHTDEINEALSNCKEYMKDNGLSEAVW